MGHRRVKEKALAHLFSDVHCPLLGQAGLYSFLEAGIAVWVRDASNILQEISYLSVSPA